MDTDTPNEPEVEIVDDPAVDDGSGHGGPTGDGAAASPGASPAEIERLRAQLEEQRATIAALAANRAPVAPPPPVASPEFHGLPPHTVAQMRAAGFSDDDIRNNASIVMPIVQTVLQSVGGEVLQVIDGLRSEVTTMKMAGDAERYPHYRTVAATMATIRDEAARAGNRFDNDTLYHLAVARELPRIMAAGTTTGGASLAATRATDASVGGGVTTSASPRPPATASPTTARDVSAMSREERRALWGQLASRTIG